MKIPLIFMLIAGLGLSSVGYFVPAGIPALERLAGSDWVHSMPFSVSVGVPSNTTDWTTVFEVPAEATSSYRNNVEQVRLFGYVKGANSSVLDWRVVNGDGLVIAYGPLGSESNPINPGLKFEEMPRMFSGDALQVRHFGGRGFTSHLVIEGVLNSGEPPLKN